MAGLGEARRTYHRGVVADRVRALRSQKRWTQEDLADRLGVDRRQVVRFETGRAPVTLEVVEALARAFGVVSMTFMFSTMEDHGAQFEVNGTWVRRLAEEEYRKLFGAAIERPGVTWLIHTAMSLPDEDLDVVGQVANAFLKARSLSDTEQEDYSYLMQSLFTSLQIGGGEAQPERSRARRPIRQESRSNSAARRRFKRVSS